MLSINVAAASSDGTVIDTHFGHAKRFLIYRISDTDVKYLEEREVDPISSYCNICQGGDRKELDAFERTAEILKDCKAIVVSKIGYEASYYLENLGFEIYEGFIPLNKAILQLKDIYFPGGEKNDQNI